MNFKVWLDNNESTLSYAPTGGVGDVATFSKPIGLVRKDMYATIPTRRRRRSSRRRYIEQQKQKKNKF
jgi:hypothetical protein